MIIVTSDNPGSVLRLTHAYAHTLAAGANHALRIMCIVMYIIRCLSRGRAQGPIGYGGAPRELEVTPVVTAREIWLAASRPRVGLP